MTSDPSSPARRATVALVACLAVGLATGPAAHADTPADADDDVGFLYAAAVGERVAREAYRVGASRVRPSEREAFAAARRAKSTTIRALSRALGEDAPTTRDLRIVFPARRVADRAAVLELVRELETALVGLGRSGLADATDPAVRRTLAPLALSDAQLLARVRGFQRRDPLRVPGRVTVERFGARIDGFLADPDQAD